MSLTIIGGECIFPSAPNVALADVAVEVEFSLVKQHPFYADMCGKPIKTSCVFPIKAALEESRWKVLLDNILPNFLQTVSNKLDLFSGYRLWCILPPTQRMELSQEELFAIINKHLSKLPITCVGKQIINGTHAITATALKEIEKQQDKDNNFLIDIVLAVDSYLYSDVLNTLESERLIHGSHFFYGGKMIKNPYGFIPSEGAAIIAVTSVNNIKHIGSVISGIGISKEENLRNEESPCIAKGLSDAINSIIASDNKKVPIINVLTDFNGEPYRADEYGFAALRLNQSYPLFKRIVPVLASGDLGCVSLLMHIALMNFRYANNLYDDNSLILSSSEDNLRAAIMMKKE